MILIDYMLLALSVILLVPVLVIFVQVLAASVIKRQFDTIIPNKMYIAVLIPAHNESLGIIATLDSIKSQLKSTDRLIVVADNCNDNTAEIAKNNGAEVIERRDMGNRGKGFALDFGMQYLANNPTDIVIIIDADCILEKNALRPLAAYALNHGRPVQALYLMYAKATDIKSKIAEFAWCVKNLVRPLGFANLGLPCQLMGTGMAFPWSCISHANLANSNIVEDMKLGIDLSIAGKSPLFFSNSKVTSCFPLLSEAQTGQSTRWEHGHLGMILSETPRLFIQGILQGNKNLLAMALDLSVPPLALLVTLLFGYTITTGLIVALFDFAHLGFQISLFGSVILTVTIGLAWFGWGRKIVSFSSILLVPVYVISKIPNYIKFLFKRQKYWNKTERD